MQQLSFTEAVQELARFDIRKQQIYLIDLVLLCEMAWADGTVQNAEREELFGYLNCHVDSINRLAGCAVLDHKTAREFVGRFLDSRPDPILLAEIRELIPVVRIAGKTQDEADQIRVDILNGCLDIAASAVTKYPYGLAERFTTEEKECYHMIERLLNSKQHSI
jgi:hypothetical protein